MVGKTEIIVSTEENGLSAADITMCRAGRGDGSQLPIKRSPL